MAKKHWKIFGSGAGAHSDSKLEARVRSAIGNHASSPDAIAIYVETGTVTLGGPVLVSELAGLLAAVEALEGVQEVLDHLEVHETAESLSEAREAQSSRLVKSRKTLRPATRLLAGAAGGALMLAGVKRHDKIGAALGGVGLGLLATGGIAGRNPVSLFRRTARDPEELLPEPVRNEEEVPVQGSEEGMFQPARL
jgi:BON domain